MRSRINLWLLVLLAICAASYWWAFRRGEQRSGALPGSHSAATATVVTDGLGGEAEAIHIVVLNGTGVAGLARDVSLQLAMSGCVVEAVGNAPHQRFERTLLINRRLDRRRAAALAERLGQVPVLREWDARSTEDAVIVLGADHEAVLKQLKAGPPE